MIKAFRHHYPSVHASAYVSQSALVMGDVTIGRHAGVWPGAVIRGDFASIVLGDHVIP